MVAMNPQTFKEDLAEVVPGGWLLYNSTLPRVWPRDDITILGVPIAEMCAAKWRTRASASCSRTWSTSARSRRSSRSTSRC